MKKHKAGLEELFLCFGYGGRPNIDPDAPGGFYYDAIYTPEEFAKLDQEIAQHGFPVVAKADFVRLKAESDKWTKHWTRIFGDLKAQQAVDREKYFCKLERYKNLLFGFYAFLDPEQQKEIDQVLTEP